MGHVIVFIIFLIAIAIAVIVATIIQNKTIGKLEKKLVPILDSLYNNPGAKEKHQLFIEALESWHEETESSYAPSALITITDKLLRHTEKYPQDKLAHERFMELIGRAKNLSYAPSALITITDKLLRDTEKYPQDRLAHERFMELIGRVENLSSEPLFQKLLSQLKVKADPLSHERFAACVSKARFLPLNLLESLFEYLDREPVNPLVQQHFLQCVTHIMLLPDAQRQRVYDKALHILEGNPDSSTAKQFVLNVGRWHFGKSRKDGRVTIYDEQRIQNDILARAA
jgi:hypothetical protein